MKPIIFILLLPFFASGQTRFYLTQKTPSITSVTPNINWNLTAVNLVWLLNTYFDRSTNIQVVSDAAGTVAPRKMLVRQLLTLPLAKQTINGTLSMQQLANYSTAASGSTFNVQLYIRVINPSGTIALEVGSANSTTSSVTSATNRSISFSFSNLSILTGQRLCIDEGIFYNAGTVTTSSGRLRFQATNATTDLPVDNTTTTALNPWIEFSQSLKFQNSHLGFF